MYETHMWFPNPFEKEFMLSFPENYVTANKKEIDIVIYGNFFPIVICFVAMYILLNTYSIEMVP